MWGYVVFLKSLDTMLVTSLLPVTLNLPNIRSEINLCYTCIWKSAERVTGIVILAISKREIPFLPYAENPEKWNSGHEKEENDISIDCYFSRKLIKRKVLIFLTYQD